MPSRISDEASTSSSSSFSLAGPSKASGSSLPPILPLSAFPDPGTPIHQKPSGYTFYKEVLQSSKYIVAPMVSASELPWRTLSRRYGADLCYSPMINCRSLVDSLHGKSKNLRAKALEWFDVDLGEEGSGEDKMLVVQLAGSDPKIILEAAEHVQDHCLAVDLNLGCPQHIAKRGHYGSYLQEDWPLIFSIINTLHLNLRIPVTAKMRVFDDVERTVAYAKMLQHAGAQIVTVHGRTREQKGHKTGVADWKKIRAVKEALDVPVFANGNILYGEDLQSALDKTGADGVMSAEGNLYNPTIFSTRELRDTMSADLFPHRSDGPEPNPEWAPFPYIPAIAHAYLDEVVQCKTRTEPGAVKGHIFKICRPALERHTDIRANIGKAKLLHPQEGQERAVIVKEYRDAMDLLDERLMADRKDPSFSSSPPTSTSKHLPPPEQRYLPHWLCQPYFRPPLPEAAPAGPDAKQAKQEKDTAASAGIVEAETGAAPAPAPASAASVSKSNGMVDPADVQTEGEKRVMASDEHKGEVDQGGDAKRIRELQQALSSSLTLKTHANALFERKLYEQAVAIYEDAIAALPPRTEVLDEEKGEEEEEEEGEDEEEEQGEGKDEGGSWVDQVPSARRADFNSKSTSKSKKDHTSTATPAPAPTATPAPAQSIRPPPPPPQAGSGLIELTEEEAAVLALQSTSTSATTAGASLPLTKAEILHAEEQKLLHSLEMQVKELRTACYANCAAGFLKLEQFAPARHASEEALRDTPDHLKALHRLSQALSGMIREFDKTGTAPGTSTSSSSSSSSKSSLLSTHLQTLQTLSSHPLLPPTLLSSLTLTQIPQARQELEEEREREKEEMLGKLKEVGDKFLGWFGLSTDNFKMEREGEGEGAGWGMKFQR